MLLIITLFVFTFLNCTGGAKLFFVLLRSECYSLSSAEIIKAKEAFLFVNGRVLVLSCLKSSYSKTVSW